MPYYVVRIELHNASSEEYETLHQNMATAGFSRTITGQDNKPYQLPTAEYIMLTPTISDTDSVRENIKKRIPASQPNAYIIVSRADSVSFWLSPAN